MNDRNRKINPFIQSQRKKKSKLESRRFVLKRDLNDVMQLYERLFNKKTTQELWEWKYLPPWTNKPFSWIGLDSKRIIGHIGIVPLRGQIKGAEVTFFLIGDIMADPDYRMLKIYRQLNPTKYFEEIRKEHPQAVMYGFTGRHLGRWYRWFLSLDINSYVERADDRIIRLPNDRLAGKDASQFDVCEWLWDAPELDIIWRQLKDTILVGLVRDRAYLDWRYAKHPTLRYRLFGVYQWGKPVGWLVTGKQNILEEWRKEVRIHDLLLPPEIRLPVLRYAASALQANSLVFWLPSNCLPSDFESHDTSWIVTHWSFSPDISKDFLSSNVYYTLGEADEWWK